MAEQLRALELSQKRRDEELRRLTKQIRESNAPQTVLRDNDRSLVPSTPRSVQRQYTKNTGDLRTLTPRACGGLDHMQRDCPKGRLLLTGNGSQLGLRARARLPLPTQDSRPSSQQ